MELSLYAAFDTVSEEEYLFTPDMEMNDESQLVPASPDTNVTNDTAPQLAQTTLNLTDLTTINSAFYVNEFNVTPTDIATGFETPRNITAEAKPAKRARRVPDQMSFAADSLEQDYLLPDANVIQNWISELRIADKENIGRCVRHTYVPHTSYYLSAYETYLFTVIEEYNNNCTTPHKATFVHGCIFFSCSVIFSLQTEQPYSWTNLIVPKSGIRELFFLLCSTNGSSLTCQPLITKGGLCSSLLVHLEPLPSDQGFGLAQVQLVLIPMVPYRWSRHAIPFIIIQDEESNRQETPNTSGQPTLLDENASPFGQATITRQNNTVLFTVKQLSWTSKRMLSGRRKRVVHYVSQFKGSWYHEFDPNHDAWISSKNIEYEFMSLPFTINVDTLVIDISNHTFIGTLSTSHCHRILDKLTARNMPRSLAFYITLIQSKHVDLQFSRNPCIFFSGDVLNLPFTSEPNPFSAVIHAPYDIQLTSPATQTVKLDIIYTESTGRCFLVANVPNNDSFYTGLRLWKNGELKITIWPLTKCLFIPQGAPIAVLYQINDTTGDIDHNGRIVFKHQFEDEQISFYLGDLKLPEINFLASYYY
ncbi:protein UL31 [Saimiriine betaherpesvirus 4]|uniref:Protein UL31 n=1 Tax=Saimiriine betaherpesvirus 4 TaxID=1535247 RepID=G8XSU5_9BETA|nr:protein UL31 [Saimiriine betaherpesvirus 4]AEV80892.1 protein UL31 [Saimiriine betaherpesvirus 4]